MLQPDHPVRVSKCCDTQFGAHKWLCGMLIEMDDNGQLEPGVIKRLDAVVVNRIAAGEIIRRPANALKELIENSLDAGSSSIQISVKFGGLKLLQIQDNGTGIRKDDLEIVCERFTTSKLKTFEDLQSIATYGFRGEALSSISHVAHLTIQTKTASEKCGYRASYEDGRLKGPIKACAGNQGTQITVEDLFYNTPQRKQMFKSPSDEYHRILDVVSKYAIHNAGVGFALRKAGESMSLRTPPSSTRTDNIRIAFGSEVAKSLMSIDADDAPLQFKMDALVSNVTYSSKKATFLLFINHRLVESTGIKNAIDQVFGTFLPKGSHPFVYMSLELEPNNVDVNVHPTKHEVKFLHEDQIIEKIKQAFEAKLVGCNETRNLYTQQLIPGASDPLANTSIDPDAGATKETRIYAKDMVRSDAKEQKLEKFFGQSFRTLSSSSPMTGVATGSQGSQSDDTPSSQYNILNVTPTTSSQIFPSRNMSNSKRKETRLTSILQMRKRIESKCHTNLRKLLSESIFVGCIDREMFLVQYETNLYLCNVRHLSEELFYQLLLYDFENFARIRFAEPLSIVKLAEMALNTEESGWCDDDGPIAELSQRVSQILCEKAAILKEYYGISISADGHLESLPMLLDKHLPAMARLPMYILRLATEVDWQYEKNCFDTFSRETATFYAHIAQTSSDGDWKWTMEHILYGNIKRYLIPSKKHAADILQIASLPNLYKVFERC